MLTGITLSLDFQIYMPLRPMFCEKHVDVLTGIDFFLKKKVDPPLIRHVFCRHVDGYHIINSLSNIFATYFL